MIRRRGVTPKNVLSWISQGKGQGEGNNYRPFLRVQDVPSTGRSSKVYGLKTGRTHHYLSDLEYSHHILAEYEPSIIDIREKYALLPWKETQEIARELGIRHPVYPGTQTPVVMTSDIVVSSKMGQGVVCVKPTSSMNPKNPKTTRVLEKLLIEKIYWQRRGIKWCVSTEKTIPMVRAKNLDILRTSLVARELDWLGPYMPSFIRYFYLHWAPDITLNNILDKTSININLEKKYCFALFGRAIWLRLLTVDIDSEIIGHNYPIKIQNKSSEASYVKH